MDKVNAESGFQLVSRFTARPSLLHLDDVLFMDGPSPGDIIQVSGESAVGKSFLLMKFIAKALLPKSYKGIHLGGLDSSVILIDTDHSISILKLVCLLEKSILSVCENQTQKEDKRFPKNFTDSSVETIIRGSLKNLIILKTYSSLQLEMNLCSIEKILATDLNVSLIVIDSLTSYYWSDITNQKAIKKMDLYLKVLIEKFSKYAEEYEAVIIYSIQEYFQSRQSEFSSSLIKHKVELKKNDELDKFVASIDSDQNFQYTLSENGLSWVI